MINNNLMYQILLIHRYAYADPQTLISTHSTNQTNRQALYTRPIPTSFPKGTPATGSRSLPRATIAAQPPTPRIPRPQSERAGETHAPSKPLGILRNQGVSHGSSHFTASQTKQRPLQQPGSRSEALNRSQQRRLPLLTQRRLCCSLLSTRHNSHELIPLLIPKMQ